MIPFDPVKRLQEAGMIFDTLPQDQRAAITSLSAEEVETLVRIQERVKGDVQGSAEAHAGDLGVLMF